MPDHRFLLFSFLTFLYLYPCISASHGQSPHWQQRVAYEMDVQLFPDSHTLAGIQHLVYYNHSPDTLHKVYYHLYFNAFHPESMMAERNRHLPDPDSRIVPRIFNLQPDEFGFQRIHSLTQNGTPTEFRIFDTVLRAELSEPILPGDSAVFDIHFEAQVPLQTRRSGRDNREGIDYSMSQWYPKIAAYDARGWHPVPYVGREFYGPFGRFDVRITLPSEYVVGATGTLQNPDAIGHGYSDTPVDHSETDSLTWYFRAEDVHDFAWAADPNYIHERFEGPGGTQLHLLYLPEVADRWQHMSIWLPRMLQFFSDNYGDYLYPQFTVAQAGDGGMEYPMITFITGRREPRSLAEVTAHELAHMWYYAMMASDETSYAWIDEGLTHYATQELMNHLFGSAPRANHVGSHLNFLAMHKAGLAERMNTPADWFETNRAFGITAYPGGAMVVDMLGYVISDSLRDQFLLRLYEDFTFRHPDPVDIRRTAERVSGLNLDWYFEQWTNTTRTLDYSVQSLAVTPTDRGWATRVRMRRNDAIVMPVDLKLDLEDGSVQWVNIPLGIMQGHKPVPPDWIVAEPWAWTYPEYDLEITLPVRAIRAEIDPHGRTPDRKRLNNTSRLLPARWNIMRPPPLDYFRYGASFRPLADYNVSYGVGFGGQFRGRYIFDRHLIKASGKMWIPVTDRLQDERPAFDYSVWYDSRLPGVGPLARITLRSDRHLGIIENSVRIFNDFGIRSALRGRSYESSIELLHQNRFSDRAYSGILEHLWRSPTPPVDLWDRSHLMSVRIGYRIADERENFVHGWLELGGAWNATEGNTANRLVLEGRKTYDLGAFMVSAHAVAGLGGRTLAPQKLFILGASPLEQQWRSHAFRTVSGFFETPIATAHLAPFSNVGPVTYLLQPDGTVSMPPIEHIDLAGPRMIAGTFKVARRDIFRNRWLRPLSIEAFSGAGAIGGRETSLNRNKLILDGGLGIGFDLAQLQPLDFLTGQSDVLAGLQFRARFPFWVSHPEVFSTEEPQFGFRWLLGVETGL